MITFGRDICGNFADAERREWLVTNGIGGFASGTIAGTLTRRYHGLLLASLRPPHDRTLMVSKIDETVTYREQEFTLYSNNWLGKLGDPAGYRFIEQFSLEGTTPVWRYALADALLEKRIWMQPGANTTYVQYTLTRASAPLAFSAQALVNYRHYHNETRAGDWQMQITPVPAGLKVMAYEGAIPFYLLSAQAEVTAAHQWHYRFHLMREANRGLTAVDDNLHAATFTATLDSGESLTLVASIDSSPNLDGAAAYAHRRAYETNLLQKAPSPPATENPAAWQQLVLAADQFIVKRPLPEDPNGRSVLAGYPWFGDRGRDTMIALPGLTLATGRPEIAAKILRTYAFAVNKGMLPNDFPDTGALPAFNNIDVALWYIEAIRAYHEATGNDAFVQQLFPVLSNIISQYQQGTRSQIRVDPDDGLLRAGESAYPLTWMDAQVDNKAVTPRVGKPIEVNALWYNALRIMEALAVVSDRSPESYRQLADRVQASFGRFWDEERGYCVDVLDMPTGDDISLRPNQLFAVSLTHSPLTDAQQKSIVDVCTRELLTSFGLRSLAPGQVGYSGSYGGNLQQRDRAYHQGTVWAWLMGLFVQAFLRVYEDPQAARAILTPLWQQLTDHGVGTVGEIFDGDPPFTPRGTLAQAVSVAELLRVWRLLAVQFNLAEEDG